MSVQYVHINEHPSNHMVGTHRHAATEVVIYLEGTGVVTMDSTAYGVGPGCFTVAPLGIEHDLHVRTPAKTLCVLLAGHHLESYQGMWEDCDGMVRETALRLTRETEEKQPGFRDVCEGLGCIMAGLVRRRIEASGTQSAAQRLVMEAIDIIEKAEGAISVAQLAKAQFVSESHIRHLFARNAPMSPIKYIQSARVKKAKDLLLATDLPLHRIAEQCGFETPQYFSRSFKNAVGCSPSEFRGSGGDEADERLRRSWYSQ